MRRVIVTVVALLLLGGCVGAGPTNPPLGATSEDEALATADSGFSTSHEVAQGIVVMLIESEQTTNLTGQLFYETVDTAEPRLLHLFLISGNGTSPLNANMEYQRRFPGSESGSIVEVQAGAAHHELAAPAAGVHLPAADPVFGRAPPGVSLIVLLWANQPAGVTLELVETPPVRILYQSSTVVFRSAQDAGDGASIAVQPAAGAHRKTLPLGTKGMDLVGTILLSHDEYGTGKVTVQGGGTPRTIELRGAAAEGAVWNITGGRYHFTRTDESNIDIDYVGRQSYFSFLVAAAPVPLGILPSDVWVEHDHPWETLANAVS